MPSRRLQSLLFALSFITFAWFHQGGGWNQNARFAEVRAIVEQGRFAVDDYMVYRPGAGRHLIREHVENAEFIRDGKVHRLCWGNDPWDYLLASVNGKPIDDGTPLVVIGWDTCTGDVGIAPDGHFHPNKPPGSSLLAVPPYFVLYHLECMLGLDVDDWWVMSVNAWLCSVFTVGLASALGVVLVLRVASEMFPGHLAAALGAALAFGFGTTFFPFGTLMFDHNITAVLLLASFAAARNGRAMSSGLWAGVAAVTNYLAAIPGAFFGLWLLLRGEQRFDWRAAVRFTLGVLPCLAVLLAYNVAAFGSPFALNTSFQNPVFKETAPAFLGMFTAPSWFAALVITISPWRGVFVLSPVLVIGVAGMIHWWRTDTFRPERRIILAILIFFFGVNVCFNGFHGGFAAGPRYLIPALPFLCLPLAGALARYRENPRGGGICHPKNPRWLIIPLTLLLVAVGIGKSLNGMPHATVIFSIVFGSLVIGARNRWCYGIALITFSIVQQSLLTVTDALNPLGIGAHVWVNHPGEWKEKITGNSLVWRYAWPIFAHNRAWPVIHGKFEEWLSGQRREREKKGMAAAEIEAELARLRVETWEKILRGETEPLWIAAMDGPVSSNVMGPWDGTYFQIFPAHSPAANWSAFNLGELIFPASRWSLAPLAALWIVGSFALRRNVRAV